MGSIMPYQICNIFAAQGHPLSNLFIEAVLQEFLGGTIGYSGRILRVSCAHLPVFIPSSKQISEKKHTEKGLFYFQRKVINREFHSRCSRRVWWKESWIEIKGAASNLSKKLGYFITEHKRETQELQNQAKYSLFCCFFVSFVVNKPLFLREYFMPTFKAAPAINIDKKI